MTALPIIRKNQCYDQQFPFSGVALLCPEKTAICGQKATTIPLPSNYETRPDAHDLEVRYAPFPLTRSTPKS